MRLGQRHRLADEWETRGAAPPPAAAAAACRLPPAHMIWTSHRCCRPQLVHGFQSPEDFTIREQTLTYTNGDSYSVRRLGGRTCAAPAVLEAIAAVHCFQWCIAPVPALPSAALAVDQACASAAQGETLGALRHGRGTHTCSSGALERRAGGGGGTLCGTFAGVVLYGLDPLAFADPHRRSTSRSSTLTSRGLNTALPAPAPAPPLQATFTAGSGGTTSGRAPEK